MVATPTESISQLNTGTPMATDLTPATNVNDTTQAPSGTTNKYVRSDEFNFTMNALGVTTYAACYASTPTNLNATYNNGSSGVGATLTNAGTQAVFTCDGVTPPSNARILVYSQSTSAQNGIYILGNVGSSTTNWVLTRSLDFDQASELVQYGTVMVQLGNTNAGKAYQLTTASPYTIGSTSLTFALFSLQFPASEVVSSSVVQGSAVSLTTNTATNVTSISLPVGSWNIFGNIVYLPSGSTSITTLYGGINSISATLPATYLYGALAWGAQVPPALVSVTPAQQILNIASPTTIYLVALGIFTVSTLGAFGTITAVKI